MVNNIEFKNKSEVDLNLLENLKNRQTEILKVLDFLKLYRKNSNQYEIYYAVISKPEELEKLARQGRDLNKILNVTFKPIFVNIVNSNRREEGEFKGTVERNYLEHLAIEFKEDTNEINIIYKKDEEAVFAQELANILNDLGGDLKAV